MPAPLRGIVYALALVIAVPLAWQDGKKWQAVGIGAIVLLGIVLEARRELRRRVRPLTGNKIIEQREAESPTALRSI